MEVTILTEQEIRESVSFDEEAIEAVGEGFSKLVQGEATVPPILAVPVPENHGEVDVKTAYIRGLDTFAVKIAAGFHENYRLGLPTGSGMMVMISSKTGFPQAVLLDNGYLTDVRTGAAGALASRYLARETIETVGVIGSGVQARYQVRGIALVRSFRRLLVYGIVPEQVESYVEEMQAQLEVEVLSTRSAEQVVRESDVVVTTTPSREPLLKVDWLHPGLHITAMGSDGEGKQELFPRVFERADLIACDRKSQCFRLGELQHALAEGVVSIESPIVELGELTLGRHPGRESNDQITVCDLTGVGVQDTSIARLAFEKALQKGLGNAFNA